MKIKMTDEQYMALKNLHAETMRIFNEIEMKNRVQPEDYYAVVDQYPLKMEHKK